MNADDLNAILDQRGVKNVDLAQLLGIGPDKVSKSRTGLRRWTATESDRIKAYLGGVPAPTLSDHSPVRKAEDGSIPLRHLDMSLSMGDGSSLDNYFEEGVFEFDANLLRTISRAPTERLVVGHGIGDSMFPTLHDRDMVIFDTTQTKLNATDKIWAISLYGAGGIKRLRPIAQDRILVMSDNQAIPPQEVDAEDLRILGRVIWSARRH